MLWLRALFPLVTLGLSLGVWGLRIEPKRLIVRPASLSTRLWPKAMDPLRIAVISDLHVGSPHINLAKVDQVVNRVNRLRADLVVLLGDYVVRNVPFGKFVEPPFWYAGSLAVRAVEKPFPALSGITETMRQFGKDTNQNAARFRVVEKIIPFEVVPGLPPQALDRHGTLAVIIVQGAGSDNSRDRPEKAGQHLA